MKIRTGTDIIEISRVKESIESTNEKFCERVYTEKEREYCESKKMQKYQHYAVRFSAKEDDEDSVRTTITPPTGTVIARWLYVTTLAAGLILAGATIVFIKKRILVK